jgi:hypothetical protein
MGWVGWSGIPWDYLLCQTNRTVSVSPEAGRNGWEMGSRCSIYLFFFFFLPSFSILLLLTNICFVILTRMYAPRQCSPHLTALP